MKKQITSIVASVLALSLIAGCGKKEETTKKIAEHNYVFEDVTCGLDYYELDCAIDGGYGTTADWGYYESTEDFYEEGWDFNTEEYNTIKENGFMEVSQNPLSTFAADVDTGSYCNLRRMIRDNGGGGERSFFRPNRGNRQLL